MNDNIIPQKNFYEFLSGWYQRIDFNDEADQLLKMLDSAKKEDDIQHYIKDNESGLFQLLFLKIMSLGAMKHISVSNRRLAKNIGQTIC